MKGCQLQTQISQLLIGQIENFLCLSDREFPEFFKRHLTFVPSHFQSGVISKMPRTCVFFGHTVSQGHFQSIVPTRKSETLEAVLDEGGFDVAYFLKLPDHGEFITVSSFKSLLY